MHVFVCFVRNSCLTRIWMQVFMQRKPKRRKPEKTVWCKKGEKSDEVDFMRWRWSFLRGSRRMLSIECKNMQIRENRKQTFQHFLFLSIEQILWKHIPDNIVMDYRAMFRKSTKEFYFQVLDLFQNFLKTKMMMVDFWYIVWGHTGRGAAWES